VRQKRLSCRDKFIETGTQIIKGTTLVKYVILNNVSVGHTT